MVLKNTKQKISVVIPVFNERGTLPQLIKRLTAALQKVYAYELIFIDDYSSDGSFEYLSSRDDAAIIVQRKYGRRGKAYSLLQGFEVASGDIIAMIDADLQYPPEAITKMVKKLDDADIVIANRKNYQAPFFRKCISKGFRTFFGRFLFKWNYDIQSGLKVFKREVLKTIPISLASPWTLDLELLYKAKLAGYAITQHNITFSKRVDGSSKVNIIRSSVEVGFHAIILRLQSLPPLIIPPSSIKSMKNAGMRYKKKKFVTHTTLPPDASAIQTLHLYQKVFLSIFFLAVFTGLVSFPLMTLQVLIAGLSIVYFVDVAFNLFIILKSLSDPQEIVVDNDLLDQLPDNTLPFYTILCPLYKEAHIIPQFLEAIEDIDWPKEKLDVLLLLEEDDKESIQTVEQMHLPSYVRMIVVPDAQPKTKPKACNYGLAYARGEYLVIYDAEDVPDPLQLKKAYYSFQQLPDDIICLQAKLNYYNPDQNLLTRFFTAEYSLWFDLTLPGLQAMQTSIPLGGTSNHFKAKDLIALQGWDPFNVTEDADLGVRLFKKGYKTAIIDSTTYEEANSAVGNWLRQRSRWIKGYLQTYFVHLRQVLPVWREKKVHSLIFHLTVGGKLAFIFLNPTLWIMTLAYFLFYEQVGATIASFYPNAVLYLAVTSLVFGNFLFMYYYMIGCAKRGQWDLIKYVFLIPLYWILISIAGSIALYQFIVKPHYWEKTVHGLYLGGKPARAKFRVPSVSLPRIPVPSLPLPGVARPQFAFQTASNIKGNTIFQTEPGILRKSALLFSIGAGIFSYGYFALFSSRATSVIDISLTSFFFGCLYVFFAQGNLLALLVQQRSIVLESRFGTSMALSFWNYIKEKVTKGSIILTSIWLLLTPQFVQIFHTESVLPFLLFAPVLLFLLPVSAYRGMMMSKLLFGSLALLLSADAATRFIMSYFYFDQSETFAVLTYSLPIVITAGVMSLFLRQNEVGDTTHQKVATTNQLSKYYPLSLFLIGFSLLVYAVVDIVLAQQLFVTEEAQIYSLVSFVSKMILFTTEFAIIILHPFTKHLKARSSESHRLSFYIFTTFIVGFAIFSIFGIFHTTTLPFFFGDRAEDIIIYVPYMAFGALCYSLSRAFTAVFIQRRIYTFTLIPFLLAILQLFLLLQYNQSLGSYVLVMQVIGGLHLITAIIMHINASKLESLERKLLGLSSEGKTGREAVRTRKILIFNWRDIKHEWAGGAEVYIHELAKRWVKSGVQVTLFCGNKSGLPKKQMIDGFQVIRKGGLYTVYLWAFLYYLFSFRGKYDLIIDCENGIPFFTPLYSRKPIILLIHHIHQDVFRKQLITPLAQVAQYLEGQLMPLLYKKNTVVTVSESSRDEILKIGIGKENPMEIIYNGIDSDLFHVSQKTKNPTFIYLGRLKNYKRIDIAIRSFAKVVKVHKDAQLYIVGEGESKKELTALVSKLKLQKSVSFQNRVSDKKKAELLSKSWVLLQPSSVEGWGLTVLEANASGTPVIAFNVNGLKDSIIANKTGILIDKGGESAFTKAMLELVENNTLRRTLADNAIVWSQQYSWDISADIFLKLIQNTIDTGSFSPEPEVGRGYSQAI